MPKRQDFSLPQGDAAVLTVDVLTSIAGDTLEDGTVVWRAYEQAFGAPYGAAVISKSSDGHGIAVLPSPPMTFTIQLTAADTEDLDEVNYYHEATVTDVIGDDVTIMTGIMTLTQTMNDET